MHEKDEKDLLKRICSSGVEYQQFTIGDKLESGANYLDVRKLPDSKCDFELTSNLLGEDIKLLACYDRLIAAYDHADPTPVFYMVPGRILEATGWFNSLGLEPVVRAKSQSQSGRYGRGIYRRINEYYF